MATITPGTGATISAQTIEAFFCGAIWLLQSLENDPVKNPSGINNAQSTISDDSQSLQATINFRGFVADHTDGAALITPLEYLTTPSGGTAHWIPGSGGTISSATIQGAIFEAARYIDKKENNAATNPTGKKCVRFSIESGSLGDGGNGEVAIAINVVSFPVTFSFNANGTQSLIGKEYLL